MVLGMKVLERWPLYGSSPSVLSCSSSVAELSIVTDTRSVSSPSAGSMDRVAWLMWTQQ